MDDLLAEFIAETREMLEALGGEVVAWEANPDDRSRLDAIFRFVHTVKGNCGFFDFPRLASLSHAAEDALADVRGGRRAANAALVTAVLAVIDRISDMVSAIAAGEELPSGDDTALIQALAAGDDAAEDLALPTTTAAAPDRSGKQTSVQRSVRLPVELLDRVMSGVSDIVLARNELARRLREMPNDLAVRGAFERLSAMITDVRDAMTRTRMQPIETLFANVPRLVRDLSAQLGKQVLVDVDGGDVELDREMIELVRDPLVHIIRNAIDHGIEAPAVRIAAGKRELGMLTLSARQSGNQIFIEIIDDGAGIDTDKLVAKAIAAGTLTQAEASALSPRDRTMLVCEAGVSTTDTVTSISGRGVGMDVVRANIERVGGSIEIDSALGQGTRMRLRVPLTLSITPALTVMAGGQKFAIPRSSIEEIVHARAQSIEINRVGGRLLARVRDTQLPCIPLVEVLEIDEEGDSEPDVLVIVRLSGGETFCLAVDQLLDHEELVIKPVAPAIMASGVFAGSTLTDDGNPVLMLDVSGIAEAGGLELDINQRRAARFGDVSDEAHGSFQVLVFTGLDGRRRALRLAIIERIEEVSADAVQKGAEGAHIVVGDELYPLAGVDADALPESGLRIARLSDGKTTLAYGFRDHGDIRTISHEMLKADISGESEGVALIDGDPVEVVDAYRLFGRRAPLASSDAKRLCRLLSDDPWFRNFLHPVIESAGYAVIGADEDVEADVAIAAEEWAGGEAKAGRVIRISTNPDAASEDGDTFYRYDRAGIAAALQVGRRA